MPFAGSCLFLACPPAAPTNLRETGRRGAASLPPRGCWFFNPHTRCTPAGPHLHQVSSLPLPCALFGFHSSNHSLLSRPGVRSLRHSWSLRSLTDSPSSILPFFHSSLLHYFSTRSELSIKKNRNPNKKTEDSVNFSRTQL
ncbi:hypothetical protein BDW02DRAFT_404103 [Decorospora gaudefroyi]|uniref:Uncharacterized protein n=1 Tax=Decorospora gaudefroyi TaxID=184978 RepID=A0A6A5K6T4_9PLEO|nr:hypothetical protein BDW02DRAFT_404103 [Decorospora gaudefroyi]